MCHKADMTYEALLKRIEHLEALVVTKDARIAELERRLGLNSDNSSKPPSSDGLRKKPAPQSLREKGQKPSGGQVGHKGETLKQVEYADVVINHAPATCERCFASLSDAQVVRVSKRQVFDIPEPRLEVREHKVLSMVCACGHITAGEFPKGVFAPVQYGPRIQATVVYMANQQLIPEDRMQIFMADVFKAPISTATIASISTNFAATVAPLQDEVLAALKAAPVKHLDETGFRVGGKTQWLQVVSTGTMTHYRVSARRKDLEPLSGISGVVVHDHWKSYFKLTGVEHSLCNAHHLRELKALMEIEKEEWAFQLYELLTWANNHARASPWMVPRVMAVYDAILKAGIAFHESLPVFDKVGRKRRVGHNLLLRLRDYKDAVLRFLTETAVPFTNNQAEQDIRMMKVKQKISGGFRTDLGAAIFATIRGFISTARKQQLNILDAISIQIA
jgi:transposase